MWLSNDVDHGDKDLNFGSNEILLVREVAL